MRNERPTLEGFFFGMNVKKICTPADDRWFKKCVGNHRGKQEMARVTERR